MKKIGHISITALVTILLTLPIWAYPALIDSVYLIKEISSVKLKQVHVSKAGQIYALNSNDDVLKMDTSGNIINLYNNKYLGQPTFIYFENPLQTALFYPAFQTIVILDQWMSEIKRIALQDLGIPYVSTVGIAPDRSIWYYDDQVKRWKKLNSDGKKVFESVLSITDENADWKSIVIRKTDILLQSNSGTIYFLNLFGQIEKSIAQKGNIIEYGSKNLKLHLLEKLISIQTDNKDLSMVPLVSQTDFALSLSIALWQDCILEISPQMHLRVWKF